MKRRHWVYVLIGLVFVASASWYGATVHSSEYDNITGVVDANEVVVSSRILGRIQRLLVDEGEKVQKGQLVAIIEDDDLQAARTAASASLASEHHKLYESSNTKDQTEGETASMVESTKAQLQAAQATLARSKAEYVKQEADTERILALAAAGVVSVQEREHALASLNAAKADVDVSSENVVAANALLKEARAHAIQARAARDRVESVRSDMANAHALLRQSEIALGYSHILAPIAGRVYVRAAREGEVIVAGQAILTIVACADSWVYAPVPETQADPIELGDRFTIMMPSGNTVIGKVINKSTIADYATQRDVNQRKRDIKTIEIKLQLDNPDMRFVPGMTAQVRLPKEKRVSGRR